MEPPLISEIISDSFLSVAPDCLLPEAIYKMHKNKTSCIMIAEKNKAVGIITESDVVGLFAESFQGACWNELTVSHVMTPGVIAASYDLDVLEAIIIAQGGRVRHIPVTDENGDLMGVVNQTELVKALVEYCRQGNLW